MDARINITQRTTTLTYVYDPMCSWCWGYNPTWKTLQEKLQENFADKLMVAYRVGGLAPDSDAPMPAAMQTFLQDTWRKIAEQLGSSFNFDFWSECQPRRSTYPACRAVIIARELGLEKNMYLGIQQAYYLHAKNPSDNQVLIQIAHDLGIDSQFFQSRLESEQISKRLIEELTEVRKLPIRGFPSLVLNVDKQNFPISLDYRHWQTSYNEICSYLNKGHLEEAQ